MKFSFKEWIFFEDTQDEMYPYKAVFMAGSPGSGKSFIAKKLFGGLGFIFADSDKIQELLYSKKNYPLKSEPGYSDYGKFIDGMHKSMQLNIKRINYWQNKGYPLVVDITGRNINLVTQIKTILENLGYDTYMFFVNSSLEKSLQRNTKRIRSADSDFAIKTWYILQQNMNILKQIFGNKFVIINNNQDDIDRNNEMKLHKMVLSKLGPPKNIENNIGREKLIHQQQINLKKL